MAELVDDKSVRGEPGHAGRLDGLEGRRPAARGVAELLLRREVGRAQPVMVLRLRLQATAHVLFRVERHSPRPPVLPDPLPPRNAIAAEQGGQEHGATRGPQEPRGAPHAGPHDAGSAAGARSLLAPSRETSAIAREDLCYSAGPMTLPAPRVQTTGGP